ncbi:MAG: hypothetical protein PPP58_02845 [Natronomonas sp.]
MSRYDPRPERRRTQDGEGSQWDLLREEAFDRDGHTCQRCGYSQPEYGEPERRLEAHLIATHGTPSFDELEKLITVCGPCHATLHSDDPAYDDARKQAPMFPRPDAPESVSTMRSDRQHVCQRCQRVADSATDLAAYTDGDRQYVVCRPCAGALLEAGKDPAAFEIAGEIDVAGLRRQATEAPVRPALLAARAVRVLRPAETRLERFVYDTPLRYLFNPIGMTLAFILLGVVASFYLF